jgi:hypothetical protein
MTVALRQRRHHHVFQHGQVEEDLRRLEHAGDAELVDLVRRLAGQRVAVEDHGAAVRLQAADADIEQRRLAGAVRADDRVRFALADVEVDIGEGVQAGKALVHVVDVQDLVGNAAPEAAFFLVAIVVGTTDIFYPRSSVGLPTASSC